MSNTCFLRVKIYLLIWHDFDRSHKFRIVRTVIRTVVVDSVVSSVNCVVVGYGWWVWITTHGDGILIKALIVKTIPDAIVGAENRLVVM